MRQFASALFTDLLTIGGVACLLAGLYLWLGAPAPLVAGGAILIYAGVMRARQEETNDGTIETDTHEISI